MRILFWVGLATLACALVACGGGSQSRFIATGDRAPAWSGRSVEDVDVFHAKQPTRPYREAGIIESRQAHELSGGVNAVMLELRRAAAARGCHGVIVTGSADEVVGHTTTTRDSYSGGAFGHGTETQTTRVTTLKGYRGVCIVYTHQRPDDPKKRAMADAGVTRKWLPAGYWQLGVNIATERVTFEVRAVPAVAPELLRVVLHLKREIKSSTDSTKPAHETCDIVLLSDGQTTTTADRKFKITPARETIEATLARSALEGALVAKTAAIQVCATEIALSDATRKRLAVLIEQVRSEVPAPAAPAAAAASDNRLEL